MAVSTGKEKDEETGKSGEKEGEVSPLKRTIPQFLAATAQNFILFDNGLVLSYPTIVVDALLNSKGFLSLSAKEVSWYVSISYICQPIGSTLSGLFMEPLGRKRSMLLLNIPFFCAWTLLYFANNVYCLYAASAILGLGVGCTEAPILTYMGEISEPRVRGALTSYAQLFGSMAYVALYLTSMGFKNWQHTAAACAVIPILTAVLVSLVPESPWWLVAKGRIREAEASLCWLRGWVEPDQVKDELQSMISYNEASNRQFAVATVGSSSKLPVSSTEELLRPAKPPMKQRLAYYFSPPIRRPFVIICTFFFFYYASGLNILRPYLGQVFSEMGMSLDTDHVEEGMLMIAILGFIGNAVCMVAISRLGKRYLSLWGLLGCAACTLGLALVTFHSIKDPIYGLYCLYALSFFSGLGVAPIPWMLQSELFPLRGRGFAAGCAAAVSYLIGFLGTNTFLDLEKALTLQGVYILYSSLSIIGVVFIYFYLPESEGRPLHQIEDYFKQEKRVARKF